MTKDDNPHAAYDREADIASKALAVDAARDEYMIKRADTREAQKAESEALDNWSRARIALARAKGHPLAGKRVTRRVRANRGDLRGTIAQTGTVTLYEGLRTGFEMRGHQPIPGKWYIASDSGKTAYTLENNAIERHGWKVVE